MSRRRSRVPPGALLSRAQWSKHGVHSRLLASDAFIAVFGGYFTPAAAPASLNAMGWVLQNRVLPGAVLSHTTAAVFHRIPVPWQLDNGVGLLPEMAAGAQPVPVISSVRQDGRGVVPVPILPVLHARVPADTPARRRRGAVLHRSAPGPTVAWGKLVVSSPLETLRELTAVMPLWDVVAAIDGLVAPGRRPPGVTVQQVRKYAKDCAGKPGAAVLRRAAALARADVRSPGETLHRLLTTHVGFPEPTPNFPIRIRRTGAMRYIDNAWEEPMIGLEYDGDGHRSDTQQWRVDEARKDELESMGWELRRGTAQDRRDPLGILMRLQRSFTRRGAPCPTPEEIRRRLDALKRDPPTLALYGTARSGTW